MSKESNWELAQANRGILQFSTYIMATEFDRYLVNEESLEETIAVSKANGIVRVYLETFREGYQPDREVVVRARDRFREAGLDVAAAICTVRYGVPGNVLTGFPCLAHKQTHKELDDMFRFAAELFDTILIDEYIWSHCQCEHCFDAKGDRTWTEFRCEQVREVCREHVIKPARAMNPNVRLIYKFPAMYEEFARQGQDIDFACEDFDGIWVGAEVGPFAESPQNMVRSQGPFRAFFLTRWFDEASHGRTGGAWVMPLEDSGYFRDSAYQTILGGPEELVLHPYGGLSDSYSWLFPGGEGQFPALLTDLPELFKLAGIVKENPVRGLVAARTPRATPWDFGKAYDANVFDYVGQLGIPIRPMRHFPPDAEGYFLSLHACSVPGYEDQISELHSSSLPIVVTNGLAALLDKEFLDRPNVHVLQASAPIPMVYDYRGFPEPYDIMHRLGPVHREDAWAALVEGVGWDSSMRYTADPAMAATVLGIPPKRACVRRNAPVLGKNTSAPPPVNRAEFHGPLILEDLRRDVLKGFGLALEGPVRVSIHVLGWNYVALHNFNDHPVLMQLDCLDGRQAEMAVTLPAASKVTVNKTEAGYGLEIGPHTLLCLAFH